MLLKQKYSNIELKKCFYLQLFTYYLHILYTHLSSP